MNKGVVLGIGTLLASFCLGLLGPTDDAQAGWRHRCWGRRACWGRCCGGGCCGGYGMYGCCGGGCMGGCHGGAMAAPGATGPMNENYPPAPDGSTQGPPPAPAPSPAAPAPAPAPQT